MISPQPTRNYDKSTLDRVSLFCLIAYFVLVFRNSWLSDDSFVSFRVIDNFINGYGLRWNTAERVQAYTNPLWTLLLIPVYFITNEIFFTVQLLSVVVSTLTLFFVLGNLETPHKRFFCTACFICSTAYIDFSSSGLENPLTHLLLALFFFVAPSERRDLKKIRICWWISGLILLNRIDSIIIILPSLLVLLAISSLPLRQRILAALQGLTPFVIWVVFATFYYGSPLPNTFYAKIVTGIQQSEIHRQGILYLFESLRRDPLTLTIIVSSIIACFLFKKHRILAAGLVLHLMYVVHVGGDFMSGRFLTSPFLLAVLVTSHSLPRRHNGTVSYLFLILAVIVAGSENLPWTSPNKTLLRGQAGIIDEKKFYFSSTGLVNASRDSLLESHPFTQRGRKLRNEAKNVEISDVIGLVGFFAGPHVHIVDIFALADPLLSRLETTSYPDWRIGHFARHIPLGYLESLSSGANVIRESSTRQMYEAIRTITRDPLFSTKRLKTILLFNIFGAHFFKKSVPLNATDVRLEVPEGTPWNDPRCTILSSDGLEVILPQARSANQLRIGLDCNDNYKIIAKFRGAPIFSTELARKLSAVCGIKEHTVLIPTPIHFDSLSIKPLTGDNLYSFCSLSIFDKNTSK